MYTNTSATTNTTTITTESAWDILINLGVTEQTLQIVISINGYSVKTLNVLYAATGYNDFEQLDEKKFPDESLRIKTKLP